MIYPFPNEGYRYRPLKEGMRGNDVIGLQYGLRELLVGGGELVPDGAFGPITRRHVQTYQEQRGLVKDGIAGIATQTDICMQAILPQQRRLMLPSGLARGMVEGESAFQLGNQSSVYVLASDPQKLKRVDLGATQLQTVIDDEATARKALNPLQAIGRLCGDPVRGLRPRHDMYFGKPGAKTHEAAWKLASGSWNAWAWTDLIAAGKPISDWKVDWVNNYIKTKIIYVQEWSS